MPHNPHPIPLALPPHSLSLTPYHFLRPSFQYPTHSTGRTPCMCSMTSPVSTRLGHTDQPSTRPSFEGWLASRSGAVNSCVVRCTPAVPITPAITTATATATVTVTILECLSPQLPSPPPPLTLPPPPLPPRVFASARRVGCVAGAVFGPSQNQESSGERSDLRGGGRR